MAHIQIDPKRVVHTHTHTYTRTRNLEPWCPTCGASEEHPYRTDAVLIRGFKVTDEKGNCWSQCLVCSGYYDTDLNETPDNHDPEKGWFY